VSFRKIKRISCNIYCSQPVCEFNISTTGDGKAQKLVCDMIGLVISIVCAPKLMRLSHFVFTGSFGNLYTSFSRVGFGMRCSDVTSCNMSEAYTAAGGEERLYLVQSVHISLFVLAAWHKSRVVSTRRSILGTWGMPTAELNLKTNYSKTIVGVTFPFSKEVFS
jgi:hypothetical protein